MTPPDDDSKNKPDQGTGSNDRFTALFSRREGSLLGDLTEPPPPTKLTETKEQWARDGRVPGRRPTPGGGGNKGSGTVAGKKRLPPGQSLTNDWPILDLGVRPMIPMDQWELTIVGAVDRPLKLSWSSFNALPQVSLTSDIHCVTAWSTYDNGWGGVSVKTLLNEAGVRPAAAFVALHSHDGYRTNLPMDHFGGDQSLIAHSWNGAPLARDHGGPVRAVVPSLYFWKSAKWLRQITFLEKDAPGYWETRGYHNLGDPWKQQRYG